MNGLEYTYVVTSYLFVLFWDDWFGLAASVTNTFHPSATFLSSCLCFLLLLHVKYCLFHFAVWPYLTSFCRFYSINAREACCVADGFNFQDLEFSLRSWIIRILAEWLINSYTMLFGFSPPELEPLRGSCMMSGFVFAVSKTKSKTLRSHLQGTAEVGAHALPHMA